MTKLVIRLFGGFHVELHGEAVHGFESDKGRALLAYLAVGADRPQKPPAGALSPAAGAV